MSEIMMEATPTGIADLFLGRIQDMSAPALFRLAGTKSLTGAMTFKHQDVRKDILLHEGSITWARTNQVDERLGQYLLCRGLISYEQFETCSRKVSKQRKLGSLLVETRAFKADDLTAHLQGQALEIILELFGWTDGEFVVTHAPLLKPPRSYPPIDWRHVLIHGVRRVNCWSKVISGVSETGDSRFFRTPGFHAGSLPLNETDRVVVELFGKRRSLVDALKLKKVSDFDLLRSFWLLKLIGALTIETDADVPALDEPGDPYGELYDNVCEGWGEREELSSQDPLSGWFFPDVLRTIWQEARTGHLEVETEDGTYGFFFSAGDVAAAGRIVDGKADSVGLPLGVQRVHDLSLRVTTSTYGKAWFRTVRSEEKILPAACLATKELLFDCVDWIQDKASIGRHLKGKFGNCSLMKHPVDSACDFFIGPTEGFVLSLIDGKTSLDELYLLSSLPEHDTARIVYQLFVMRMIEPQETGEESKAGAHPSDDADDAGRETFEVEPYLLEFASTMDQVDDHAVLGVDRDATEQEIKKAYVKRVKEFHPDRAPTEKSRQTCEKIVQKVMQCHQAALDRLQEERRDPDVGETGPVSEWDVSVSSPKPGSGQGGARLGSKRAMADSAYRRGKTHRKGGDVFSAIECFRIAVKCCPFEGMYRLALGQALAANPKWRREAEVELLKVLEFEPRSVETYLSLGALYDAGGKMSRAIEVYKKALFFEPNNQVARRELKKLQRCGKVKTFFSGLGT